MSERTCKHCGANDAIVNLSKCGGCLKIRYCSRECQKHDRDRHRPECRAIMEARKLKRTHHQLWDAVENENLTTLQHLLTKNEINVNDATCWIAGQTPLYLACSYGSTSVVEILLTAEDIDANQAETDDGCTPLWIACQNGHAPVIELLLASSGIDVNQARMTGSTPLWIACQNGHASVVELLLASSGIDVNQAKTDDGATPLSTACQNGHAPVVELLLASSEIDVNQALTDDDGSTPLYWACSERHTHIVELLLAVSSIDLNKGCQGWSPLRIAQRNNSSEIVQLLEDAGAQ